MPHIVVIGAGLLGGSLLAALQARRGATADSYRLTAVSSPDTLDALRARGWCDALFDHTELAAACTGADLVLICTPLSSIRAQVDAIAVFAKRLAADAIVSDVGSTKYELCQHAFRAFPDRGPGSARFVGGHPMAGSEKTGLDASDAMLFQSALWVLCPPPDLAERRLDLLTSVVRATGARIAAIDPAMHDAAAARISHVPQVVASLLSAWAGSADHLAEQSLALAAGGFRDMTRLALSSWGIWRDIVATNAGPIGAGLRELSDELVRLADATETLAADRTGADPVAMTNHAGGVDAIAVTFGAGRAFRERFHMPRKGITHDLTELVVRLDDRPGELLAVLSPLAAMHINVQDLEILKVREGEAGTLLLGFSTSADADRARVALTDARFRVSER